MTHRNRDEACQCGMLATCIDVDGHRLLATNKVPFDSHYFSSNDHLFHLQWFSTSKEGYIMHKRGQFMTECTHPTCAYSIHNMRPRISAYSIYLIHGAFYPCGPRLGPKASQSQPSLTTLAQPVDFASPSR